MNQRHFLQSAAGAGAAATASVLSPSRAPAWPAPGRRRPGARYPKMHVLTAEAGIVDGRPSYSPDGKPVLFMRGPAPEGEPSALYTIPANGGTPQQLTPVAHPELVSLTRPDWSWHRNFLQIAFSGNGNSIYLIDHPSGACELIKPGAKGLILSYPSWYPDGQHLSVTNYDLGVSPTTGCSPPDSRPYLLRLDLQGNTTPLTDPNPNDPNAIWTGMSSVSPGQRFGAPPPIASWHRSIARDSTDSVYRGWYASSCPP
jgi:hypothetical protein